MLGIPYRLKTEVNALLTTKYITCNENWIQWWMWCFKSNNNNPDCHDPADCTLQQSPKMLTIRKNRQTTFIISLDSHQPPEWQSCFHSLVEMFLPLLVVLVIFYYVLHFLPLLPYTWTLIRVLSFILFNLTVLLLSQEIFSMHSWWNADCNNQCTSCVQHINRTATAIPHKALITAEDRFNIITYKGCQKENLNWVQIIPHV